MKKLISVVEQYRFDTEEEATRFIEECKEDAETHGYTLKSYSSTKKEKKAKGEVVDEWIRFEVTKLFNEEAEPTHDVTIDYEIEDAWIGPNTEEDEE